MRTTGILAALIALCLFAATSVANAQATRTWVSGVGDDVNPCSRTAPCKTFAGAISKTATNGEINCLDPGGFGGVTITKAISIICYFEAGVLVSGTNAIIINTPAAAKVLLQGLDIEGLGTGLDGIRIISASKVTIQNCWIRNFTQNAIDVIGPATTRADIIDSFIIGNAGGVNVGSANTANAALLLRTVLDNNSSFGAQVANTSALFISDSKILGSANGLIITAGGVVSSTGDNMIQGAGLPTTTPGYH